MQKNIFQKTIFIFVIPYWFFTTASSVFAGDEDLRVVGRYRLTHPYYYAGNLYFGNIYPFSSDGMRVWMVESSGNWLQNSQIGYEYKHPAYGKVGRGRVWGYLNDLKTDWGASNSEWTLSIADYESKTKDIPDTFSPSDSFMHWSTIAGESGVLYAPSTDGYLKKYDTNSQNPAWTNNAYLNSLTAFCFGFDKDNKLICSRSGDTAQNLIAVDVVAKTAVSVPAVIKYFPYLGCGDTGHGYTYAYYNELVLSAWNHGHSVIKPDLFGITFGYGVSCDKMWNFSDGTYVDYPVDIPPYGAHGDWRASDKWFITDAYSEYNNVSPAITEHCVRQIYFNQIAKQFGDTVDVYCQDSAVYWQMNNDLIDYHAGFLPISNLSGTQIIYTAPSPDHYSFDDYHLRGSEPWDMNGVWLLEVDKGGDNQSPVAPSGLSVQ